MSGEKKYKNSMVLGKFLPYTLGHRFLIDSAISQSHNVYVYVCTMDSDIINGYERYTWIKDDIGDRVNLIHIHQDLPQYPNQHVDFWKIWKSIVEENLPDDVKLDAIFTSELYGDKFSEVLNCQHILVDLERKNVPISATKVRESPFKYWKYLPQSTKSGYSKKIAIVGPESTGKSTIVKRLSQYYNCPYLPEYGREYCEINFSPNYDMSLFTSDDALNISNEHIKRSNNLINTCDSPLIFFDTEIITTMTWCQLLTGSYPEKFYDIISSHNKIDMFILLYPNVEWVDDGTRRNLEDRLYHFNLIKNAISKYQLPLIINQNDYDTRLNKCIELINKKFNINY